MVNFGSRRTNADLGFRHSLFLPRKIVPVRNARPIRSADAARSDAVRNAVPIRRFSSYGFLGEMVMKGALCAIGSFSVRSGAAFRMPLTAATRCLLPLLICSPHGRFGRFTSRARRCPWGWIGRAESRRLRRSDAHVRTDVHGDGATAAKRFFRARVGLSSPVRRASATDRDRSFFFAKVRFRSAVSEAVRYHDAMNFARRAEASSCIAVEMIGLENPFAVVSTAGTGECRAVCYKPGKGTETDSRPDLSGPADQYCRNLGVMISA